MERTLFVVGADNGRKRREDRATKNDGQMTYSVGVNIRVNH
jgi:hypothetical protein